MFWGLIILNCTIKTRMIYFGAATEGITPKISFTLVLLVHVPYQPFLNCLSFKSFGYLIFPFFAIIKQYHQRLSPAFARNNFFPSDIDSAFFSIFQGEILRPFLIHVLFIYYKKKNYTVHVSCMYMYQRSIIYKFLYSIGHCVSHSAQIAIVFGFRLATPAIEV